MSHIEKSTPSRVIVVLGMHRSGTSALAGTFGQIGLNLGSKAELMPATADANPKGYFEHIHVVRAHDRLLAALGMDWADPRPLPEGWLRHAMTLQVKAELQALVSELVAAGGTAVIKDPRLCRFVPLWRELLAEQGVPVHFAFIVRHPAEIAASLRRRDGMSEYRSGLLSLTYQLEAEEATRGASRLFLSYEDLLSDWRAQLARCRKVFGKDVVPAEFADAVVDGFLDAQLRNHASAEVHALDPDVIAAYDCFISATRQPADLPTALDAIRGRFEAARRGYAAATEAALSALAIDHERRSAPKWSRGLELASAWNSPMLEAGPPVPPRLYGRVESGAYTEDCSVEGAVIVLPGGVCVAAMSVDDRVPLEWVRFDPDASPGAYELLEVSIDGNSVDDIPGRVTIMHEQRLVTPGIGIIAWAAQGEDPWIELNLSGVQRDRATTGSRRIEFKYRRVTAYSLLEASIDARCLEQLRSLDSLRHAVAGLIDSALSDANAQREQSAAIQQAVSSLGVQGIRIQQNVAANAARLDALSSQIGGLFEIVRELKSRSDRPVLHRLRRWRQKRRMKVLRRAAGWEVSLDALANVDKSGDGRWVARNSDPQFLLRAAGAANDVTEIWMRPGWYVLSLNSKVFDGDLVNPCLYPDYGHGASGSDRICLVPYDSAGCSETIFCLRAGARSLRLDPTDENAQFEIRAFLRPLSRHSAWLHMLRSTFKSQAAGGVGVFNSARTLMSTLLLEGVGALRGKVVSDYQLLQSHVVDEYSKWMSRNERSLSPCDVEARLSLLPRLPMLSVVMPIYETPDLWLRRALDSVINQYYPNWELCIADDASPSAHVRKVLEEYLERDRRLKVVYREKNGHISVCSNSALEVAEGEYVVLLDHDDELHPEALLLVAEAICEKPGVMLIYSDEDKIDERGNRFDPYFKPEWNYDLFLGQNCISHLGVYSRQLLREIGGFREGFEGSQDWDLALRCIERISPEQIVHIPRVLYHWRAIEGSTALGAGEKNYAIQAGRRAVADHLTRMKVPAKVEILPQSMLRVVREIGDSEPLVTLIIPTRDRVDLLKVCVGSILRKTTYRNYEILIVDNDSSEPETFEFFSDIEATASVRIIKFSGEFNYSAINNFAVESARGTIVGLINNDIEVQTPEWLEELVSHALRPDVGAVGAMLYYPDETIQHAGVLVGLCGVAGHIGSRHPRGSHGYFGRMLLTQELSAVTAACLIVRKDIFLEIGGLDERLQVAFNDVDFCLRLRQAGYRNIWTPFAELYHHESASRGLEDSPEKAARFASEVDFMRKNWGGMLSSDPAYNPNLSLVSPFGLDY